MPTLLVNNVGKCRVAGQALAKAAACLGPKIGTSR